MDPDLRSALLIGGLIFVGLFAAMTVSVARRGRVHALTVAAAVIVFLLALPLIGALRHPPD